MKNILIFLFLFFTVQIVAADTIVGNIEKKGTKYLNKIVDMDTKKPIPFALVRIPSKNFEAYTDENGMFRLNADINGAAILAVEKDGYKPFSITISKDNLDKPIVIGIEKNKLSDLFLEKDVIHLGDDSYSVHSANSYDFRLKSIGPYYIKKFNIKDFNKDENVYFVIGSIIGIDTRIAHNLGKSRAISSYASPPEIYFNGQKIAEIKMNGDEQQILLPKQLINVNSENNITIKTGKNLFQTSHVDYDDIEFANLYIKFVPAIANSE